MRRFLARRRHGRDLDGEGARCRRRTGSRTPRRSRTGNRQGPRTPRRSRTESRRGNLDRHAAKAPQHVDPVTDSVAVLTDPTAIPAARAFVAGTGAGSGPVRLVPVTARTLPMDAPFEYIRGGDAIDADACHCSAGFSVHGGTVSRFSRRPKVPTLGRREKPRG